MAIIGGIIACSSQPAKSGGDAKTSSAPGKNEKTAGAVTSAAIPSGEFVAKDDTPQTGATLVPAAGKAATNISLAGRVQIAGSPVAGATVTLYAAGTGAPAQLAQGQSDADGAFHLDGGQGPEGSGFILSPRRHAEGRGRQGS